MSKVTIDFELADFFDCEDEISAKDALRKDILAQVRYEISRKTGSDIVKEIHEQVKQFVDTTFKKEVAKQIKKVVKDFHFLTYDGKDCTAEEWLKKRFEYHCDYYNRSNFTREIEKLCNDLVNNCFEEFKKAKKQQVIDEFEKRFAEQMSKK